MASIINLMIQLPRRQSKKQIAIVGIIVVVLLCAVGVGAYMFFNRHSELIGTKKQPSAPPTVSADRLEVEPHDHDPGAVQEGIEGVHTSDESAGAAAFPTTQPNLVVEITSVKQASNQFASLTTITPKAEGACTIELTRQDNNTLTKTSPLVAAGNTSACKDTTIDVSQAARGEWTLTVKVQVGSNVATATKSVILK